jgi:hypothetical protein
MVSAYLDGFCARPLFNTFAAANRAAFAEWNKQKGRASRNTFEVYEVQEYMITLEGAGFSFTINDPLKEWLDQNKETAENQDWSYLPHAPFPYQVEGIQWLRNRKQGALLHDDMGLGKTMQTVLSLSEGGSAVIVCPASVQGVWAREISLWTEFTPTILRGRDSFRWPVPGEVVITNYHILPPADYTFFRSGEEEPVPFHVMDGAICEHLPIDVDPLALSIPLQKMVEYGIEIIRKSKKSTVTFEAFDEWIVENGHDSEKTLFKLARQFLCGEYTFGKAPKWPLSFAPQAPRGCVLASDEVHYLKSYKAARTRNFRGLRSLVTYNEGKVIGLTGTPILNRPGELWTVLQTLGLGKVAYGNYNNFLKTWGGHKGKYGIEWGNVPPGAAQSLRAVALGRRKGDVLKNLPEKRWQTIPVEPDAATLKIIAEELYGLSQSLEDGKGITVDDIVGSKICFEAISRMRARAATVKRDVLREMVENYEDSDTPLIVFSQHLAPLDFLQGREGWGVIDGSTPNEERTRIVERFQAGKLKGVAGTRAMCEGVTLTRASNMIFVDRFWSPGINTQAEDRIHRVGQNNGCLYMDLVLNHPIDELVYELLTKKEQYVREVDTAAGGRASIDTVLSSVTVGVELEEEAPAAEEPDTAPRFAGVIKLFDHALENNLKYPKIRLRLKSGSPLVLALVRSGRNIGKVNITESGYGSTYYGRLSADGHPENINNPEILDLLTSLVNNTAETALLYGTETGNCCFCGKELTRVVSKEFGYGPVCAQKWGLPFDYERYNKAGNDRVEINLGYISAYDITMGYFDLGMEGINGLEIHGQISREQLTMAIQAIKRNVDLTESDLTELNELLASLPEG